MKGLKNLILIAVSLFTTSSYASENILMLRDGDKLGNLMKSLFCELGAGCTNDAFSVPVGLFNAAIMIFCGFMTTYAILKLIMNTSINGSMGGDKQSFFIIRFVLGIGLLIPVPNYSVFNYLVFQVSNSGLALGSTVARAFTTDENIGRISATTIVVPDSLNLSHNIFLSSVCRRGIEKYFKDDLTYQNSAGGKKLVNMGITKSETYDAVNYHFGNTNSSGYAINYKECGTITIPKSQKNDNSGAYDKNSRKIAQLIEKRTLELMGEIDKIAIKFVEKPKYEQYQDVMDLSYGYQQAIKMEAYNLVKDKNEIKEIYKTIEDDGFLHAGAMTTRITRIVYKTNQAISKIPTSTGIPAVTNIHMQEYFNDEIIAVFNLIVEKMNSPISNGITLIDGNSNGKSGNNDASWWDKVKEIVTNPAMLLKRIFNFSAFMPDANDNIFMVMQSYGGWLLLSSGISFGAAIGLNLTLFNLSPGGSSVVSTLLNLFIIPIGGFGALCLYVLPMIPVFMWYGAIIAFVCSSAGAILVGTFIPASLILGGSDVFGQSANAFKQLVSMFFKPSILVMSLFLAITLVNLLGQLIMPYFFDIWKLAQDGSGYLSYLYSLVLMPFVFCLFMYYLNVTIFGTCLRNVDNITSWMSGAHGFDIQKGAAETGSTGATMGASAAGAAMGSVASNAADFKNARNTLAGKMGSGVNNFNGGGESSGSVDKGVGGAGSLSEARNLGSSSSGLDETSKPEQQPEPEPEQDADYSSQIKDHGLDDKYQSGYDKFKTDNPEASHNEAARYAYSSAISSKYGAGAGKVVSAAGAGNFNDENSKTMLSMYGTAKENGVSRSDLKTISSNVLESGKTGMEALQSFSANYNNITENKN